MTSLPTVLALLAVAAALVFSELRASARNHKPPVASRDQPVADATEGDAMRRPLLRNPHPVQRFRSLSHKGKALATTGAVCMICASSALAYFLVTQGAGSGSATVGSAASSLTLHPQFADGLTPGTSTPLTITADNGSSGPGKVTSLTVKSITDSAPSCDASQFAVVWPNNQPSTTEQTLPLSNAVNVPAGSGTGGTAATSVLTGASVKFTDSGDQTACAGSQLTISLTSN